MRKNKYNNSKTSVDGITFDSKKEVRRYGDLKLLERAGDISRLELQPQYSFNGPFGHIGKYKADFRYVRNGEVIVEDVKSPVTAKKTDYRLRVKMMKAFYNIDVLET